MPSCAFSRSAIFWRARSSRVGARSVVIIDGATRSTIITGRSASAKGEGSRCQLGPAMARVATIQPASSRSCGKRRQREGPPTVSSFRRSGSITRAQRRVESAALRLASHSRMAGMSSTSAQGRRKWNSFHHAQPFIFLPARKRGEVAR